eukprot:TRINITY_DN7143_c0_g1_i1.p1 TRINITY_DN7143_c0_g1~~TRINITY_DN7143_c0_g1_i1.p1  ORF type:complete len:512 (+),score=93.32 TRINITY_DN7143_c0_g1_i1:75-1538(+)
MAVVITAGLPYPRPRHNSAFASPIDMEEEPRVASQPPYHTTHHADADMPSNLDHSYRPQPQQLQQLQPQQPQQPAAEVEVETECGGGGPQSSVPNASPLHSPLSSLLSDLMRTDEVDDVASAQEQLLAYREQLLTSRRHSHPDSNIFRSRFAPAPSPVLRNCHPRQKTCLFTHLACLNHNPSPLEAPSRLESVLKALCGSKFGGLEWRAPSRPLPMEDVYAVHDRDFVDSLLLLFHLLERRSLSPLSLDPPFNDTVIGAGSKAAVWGGAASVVSAVDAVLSDQCRNAFCAVRPPGHHAEPHSAKGFCVLNHVAIGACHGVRQWGLSRVAIVDFDAHHASGTSMIFKDRVEYMVISIYRVDIFPLHKPADSASTDGNIFNFPVSKKHGRQQWREALPHIQSLLWKFQPQLVMLSAGFDAHLLDNVDHSIGLVEEDYDMLMNIVIDVADATCGGRVVSVLEGGYNPDQLAKCCSSHVKTLMRRASSGLI